MFQKWYYPNEFINHIKTKFWTRQFLWCDNTILIYLALAKLVIHLLTSTGYGYFGDELYWQALAKHLDFGYVDVPPLVAYLAAISRLILGTSLFAIHILPAIAGAVMVYFAGLTAREIGAGRFAQCFSALAVLVAPYILFVNSVFTYDLFEQLGTIILFYLVVRIINRDTPKRWITLGILAGLGVMTKLTIIYTDVALVISLLLTSRRKSFLTVWPWLAALIAALICAPFVVWQSVHGWPLLTYFHNYASSPGRPHQQPLQFFMSLFFFQLNPFFSPVWLLGLFYVLFHREGKKYRILGFTSLILVVFYTGLMKLESREIVSACFPLLAAGAVWLEKIISGTSARVSAVNRKIITSLKWVYISVIIVSATLMAPGFIPVMPVSDLAFYWIIDIPTFIKECDYQPGAIPHHFKFSSGWPEMVRTVAAVYHSLPKADQKKCVIWAGQYWDAGAIDLLGKQYGLPDAISNCHAYQIWGENQFNSGKAPEVAIILPTCGRSNDPTQDYFDEITPGGVLKFSGYSIYMGYEIPIFICRKPKANFLKAWKEHPFYF